MTVSLLIAELTRDEGLRLTVYDDATGVAIKPGTLVKGHPTIGIGRALDVRGITAAEANTLLANDIASVQLGLIQAYTWWGSLDDVRQRVLMNMAFNMGLGGLATFRDMLAALAAGKFADAAQAMEDSEWSKETGARASRLIVAMRTGVSQ